MWWDKECWFGLRGGEKAEMVDAEGAESLPTAVVGAPCQARLVWGL